MEEELGLTPYLTVGDAAAAIEFYTKAFGAKETARHASPDGKRLMHVRMELFGSTLMFADDFPQFCGGKSRTPTALGGSSVNLALSVPDAQAVWDAALSAGATEVMPLKEQFWGALYGQFTDPFGHSWSVSQTISRPSEEEMAEGAKAAFK